MKVIRTLGIVFVFALAFFALHRTARADEWNKKTIVTFSDSVQLPGAVLQPGTYVFKLADSQSNRNIVQVFDRDQMKLITTVMAIPNYRLEPSGRPTSRRPSKLGSIRATITDSSLSIPPRNRGNFRV